MIKFIATRWREIVIAIVIAAIYAGAAVAYQRATRPATEVVKPWAQGSEPSVFVNGFRIPPSKTLRIPPKRSKPIRRPLDAQTARNRV